MVPFEAGRRRRSDTDARFLPLEGTNHILRADEPAWLIFKKELNEFLGATSRPMTLRRRNLLR